MSRSLHLPAIQACIRNQLDADLSAHRLLAGVIGDAPSRYSRSPALWNAAFRMLGIDALYAPLDVAANRLSDLMSVLRSSERVLGVNVTVPYKANVMKFLDSIDPGAMRVQAVNTIARTPDGRLVGYNTDGAGFMDSLLRLQVGHSTPFIERVGTLTVLVLGAGGSARAVGFHLADVLTAGELLVCNRTWANAAALAENIRAAGGNARAVPEGELAQWAVQAGLIVNCTTKGQAALEYDEGGRLIRMEDYSALAPIGAPATQPTNDASPDTTTAPADVERNHAASLQLAAAIPKHVRFYDLIYAPAETLFLRHARLTGHRTMNGKAMIVCQAARALVHHLCNREIAAVGGNSAEIYKRVVETMHQAWE